MIERAIKIYTEKLSRLLRSDFAILDNRGKVLAKTDGFGDSVEGLRFELNSSYGVIQLYVKPKDNTEEVSIIKFFYEEILNYEGYIDRLVSELASRQEELGLIYDIIAKAGLVFDEAEIARIVLDKINSLIFPSICIIGIFENGTLNQKYVSGEVSDEIREKADKLIKRAIENKSFVIASNYEEGLRSGYLAVPMFSGNLAIGGIFVCNETGGFDTVDAKMLLTLGNYAGIILYRNKLVEEIKRAEALKKEIEIARRIQENLLPKEIPKIEGLDICAYIEPSSSVGGDYYDFISDREREMFLVADVSGHGIGAALLLASIRSVVRLMYGFTSDIIEFLNSINKLIYKDTADLGMYSTLLVCEYRNDSIVYANAGHVPPIFFRYSDKNMYEFELHGAPIGLLESESYKFSEVRVSKGDIIVIFTDGVTEMRNAKGEFFGVDRLKKVIFENCERSAVEICNAVISDLMDFKGDVEQKDDVTLLVLKKI